MQFRDIIGQQAVKLQLVNLVRQNRLSHALLFLGKPGSGALSLGLAFSQYIVCTSAKIDQPSQDLFGGSGEEVPITWPEDSCGQCPACIKAEKLIHPDIHYSYPVITKKAGEKPKSTDYISEWREFIEGYPYGTVYDWLQFIDAENKQGNIYSAEIEDINHKLNLKSFESRYKILIIWMPEFLGKEGNKLLKLIEEPPPDTIFIFIAEDESQILPTILSRTQLIKIPCLTDKEIEEALISRASTDQVRARQIAGICDGNYREALQILQHAEEDWQGLAREWLNAILKTGPAAQIKWIDEISRLGRERQKQFLRYFIHLLQQAIRIRVTAGMLNVPANENDFASRLNKIAELPAQEAMIKEFEKAIGYIERNAHGKMLFHALTIRVYHIIKDNSLILIN